MTMNSWGAAVARGARYLRSYGDDVAGKEIRAMVPVNLRFGLAPVVLPINLYNPVERVYEVRRRIGQLKGSMQAIVGLMTRLRHYHISRWWTYC